MADTTWTHTTTSLTSGINGVNVKVVQDSGLPAPRLITFDFRNSLAIIDLDGNMTKERFQALMHEKRAAIPLSEIGAGGSLADRLLDFDGLSIFADNDILGTTMNVE